MSTVEERADGTVGLAEAYAADGVLNLILDTTVALLGATTAGFHGLEHTEDRAFRWTIGEARINSNRSGNAACRTRHGSGDDRAAEVAPHRG